MVVLVLLKGARSTYLTYLAAQPLVLYGGLEVQRGRVVGSASCISLGFHRYGGQQPARRRYLLHL
jgi:hypothetical protein